MTTDITTRTQSTLARMAHGHSVRVESVDADVAQLLRERRLITEHTEGLLQPTSRAAGYCADPSTFEA